MKGLELPINALVIIVVAVIVMIALIAMFYPAFLGGTIATTSESAKSTACAILVEAKNCNVNTNTITISNFDANRHGDVGDSTADAGYPTACDGTAATNSAHDNLATLCLCYYSSPTEASCKALCGCSGGGGGGGGGLGPCPGGTPRKPDGTC